MHLRCVLAADGYRLTAELEWELYELPPVEEDEEVTAEDDEAALAEMAEAETACVPQEEIETIETKTEEIPHGSAD